MSDSQRNLLILIAIAILGVVFSGAFGVGAGLLQLLLNTAFTVIIVAFGVATYRRQIPAINQLDPTAKFVMHGCVIGLFLIVITGMLTMPFLPYPPFGWSTVYPLLFWGSLFALGFGVWWAWQQRSRRW